MLFLVVIVVVLNVLTSRTESEVSPIDEREHIDHLIRASQGDVPQKGTVLTQETLREVCRRNSEYFVWPGCTAGRLDPTEYTIGGVNAADDDPFYYLVTGPVARALSAVTPGAESLVTWGRVLGSMWLLAAFYLLLRAGEVLAVPRRAVVTVLVLLAALPVVLNATTTVGPDATTLAAGAAVLLAAVSWERSGRRLWVLGAVAGVAIVVRNTNAVGILVVLAYLGIRALAAARHRAGHDSRPWARYVVAGGVVIASSVVALGAWQLIDDSRSSLSAPTVTQADRARAVHPERRPPTWELPDPGEGLPTRKVLGGRELFELFPPVQDSFGPVSRTTGPNAPWYRAFAFATELLMAGALLLMTFRLSLTSRTATLGVATAVAIIVASPLLVLYDYYVQDAVNLVVRRFGLSALPAIALVVAAAARERLGYTLLAVLAAGLYLTALLTLT